MEKFDPEQYTKYEKARILGARALQISANAPILIKISKEELEALNFDPVKIAEMEFERGVLPITVKRPLPKKIEKRAPEVREIVKEEEKAERGEKEEAPEEKAKVEEAEEIEAEAEEMIEEAIAEEIESTETETFGEE